MSDNIKWDKELSARRNGVRRVELSLKPPNIFAWLKFFFTRQSYYDSVKNMTISNEVGIRIDSEKTDRHVSLIGYKIVDFYNMKKGEYKVNCEISSKCDGWILNFKVDNVPN